MRYTVIVPAVSVVGMYGLFKLSTLGRVVSSQHSELKCRFARATFVDSVVKFADELSAFTHFWTKKFLWLMAWRSHKKLDEACADVEAVSCCNTQMLSPVLLDGFV